MYKISFYVPEDYIEQVKNALFDAGLEELVTTPIVHGKQKA